MTLIEIVVVITILALLMTAVAVNVTRVARDARRDVAVQDLRNALNMLEMYRARRGRYPTTAEGLRAVVDAQLSKKMPKDPWGTELVYTLHDGEPVIVSLGADGQVGGPGDDEDISSQTLPQ